MITAEQANRIRVKRYGVSSTRSQNLNADHPLKFDRLPAMFREPRFEQLARDLEKTGGDCDERTAERKGSQLSNANRHAERSCSLNVCVQCRVSQDQQNPRSRSRGKLVRAVRFVKDLDRTVSGILKPTLRRMPACPLLWWLARAVNPLHV